MLSIYTKAKNDAGKWRSQESRRRAGDPHGKPERPILSSTGCRWEAEGTPSPRAYLYQRDERDERVRQDKE